MWIDSNREGRETSMSTTSSGLISHSFHSAVAEIWSGCFAVSWGKVTTEYDSKQTASQTP